MHAPHRPTRLTRRAFGASLGLAAVGTTLAVNAAPAAAAAPAANASAAPAPSVPLTNLAHLNFLLDDVPLPPVPGHTTFALAERPHAKAPWTYADGHPDGTYTRVGGGTLDPATGHWSQGAYNADDIARAAVVYLRHWRLRGDALSRDHAVELLRTLTYLQTATGPNAGNVVLWQQADGSLNPSAEPVELPDPSDSAESYWLARTVWALGEGYAAFAGADAPVAESAQLAGFAEFLRDRLHLALSALSRQSLGRYGTWASADGEPVPAWLIAGGADASAEAVLGLAAYVRAAPSDTAARDALAHLTEGIAAMSSGTTREWPFGAILPWTKSRSLWHAWGGLAPAAVASAAPLLGRDDLLEAALRDTAQFTPQLLTTGGPDNAWSPTPGEAQIAYGVDSRLQSLLATADAARAPGLEALAAVAACWYFGANRSGLPAYHPATGTAIDGIETDGRINPNSGAESTIHALLSMLLLDGRPALKARALEIQRSVEHTGLTVVEAESGAISGGEIVTVPSAWTGEANLSGAAYVQLTQGGCLTVTLPASAQPRYVYPIVLRTIQPAGDTAWSSGSVALGTTPNGGAGEAGLTDAPGVLLPLTLAQALPAGATRVTARAHGPVSIDALLVQPQIASVTVAGAAVTTRILVSSAPRTVESRVDVPQGCTMTQRAFDAHGRAVAAPPNVRGLNRSGRVRIVAGGFTEVRFERR